MSSEFEKGIVIQGAREHNLKNITLEIPRDKFVVVTGVSGSGKSTLAFDLIFAEGQRRFLDSMNTYARQFVEQMARPEVDLISGLPPTVSIEQRNSRGGGKSTVATVTEMYHFFRLLFARMGIQFCPDCHIAVEPQTRDQVKGQLTAEVKKRGDLLLLAPLVRNRKGFHTDIAQWAHRHGFSEIRADGKMYPTHLPFRLDRFKEHDIEVVVGVLDKKKKENDQALIEETLNVGQGTLLALDNHGKTSVHSTLRACSSCGRSFEGLDPKMFSYNSARGWCPECRGFGELFYLPEVERGARADSIEESWFSWQEGEREECPSCHGHRLNAISAAVRLPLGKAARTSSVKTELPGFLALPDLGKISVENAAEFFSKLQFSGREGEIARDIVPEIRERLRFLGEVGLGYLELGRAVTTLSSGEAQRIRLAAQLGSTLTGVLYVLDEPTIGLHARDNERLLSALHLLHQRGNSLLVVEHDEETMKKADFIVDLGPGAGVEGGQVVAAGTLEELLRHEDSVTGRCLRATSVFPTRGQRRVVDKKTPQLSIKKARRNNLKNVSASFPLGRFVVVTGVSGSGKSTLVLECLSPSLSEVLAQPRRKSKPEFELTGYEGLRAAYEVDQSPIGRTPRSIPATYVGFFDDIRQLFSQVPEARLRGYSASRFSFNSVQGRCPTCEGSGNIKLEMNFLPPAFVKCETCLGSRFNQETLDILYHGKTIAQVLELSVAEALEFFSTYPKIKAPLQALVDTGLHYLKLGQTSPTLSGGEAQRIKLVTHLLGGLVAGKNLRRPADPRGSFFILEEPTIGLHMADVRRLVEVIQRLVDAGNTVLVIEHHLELIAEADWVIDLGPEAGEQGGAIVVEGTPEAVAADPKSITGKYLKPLFKTKKR